MEKFTPTSYPKKHLHTLASSNGEKKTDSDTRKSKGGLNAASAPPDSNKGRNIKKDNKKKGVFSTLFSQKKLKNTQIRKTTPQNEEEEKNTEEKKITEKTNEIYFCAHFPDFLLSEYQTQMVMLLEEPGIFNCCDQYDLSAEEAFVLHLFKGASLLSIPEQLQGIYLNGLHKIMVYIDDKGGIAYGDNATFILDFLHLDEKIRNICGLNPFEESTLCLYRGFSIERIARQDYKDYMDGLHKILLASTAGKTENEDDIEPGYYIEMTFPEVFDKFAPREGKILIHEPYNLSKNQAAVLCFFWKEELSNIPKKWQVKVIKLRREIIEKQEKTTDYEKIFQIPEKWFFSENDTDRSEEKPIRFPPSAMPPAERSGSKSEDEVSEGTRIFVEKTLGFNFAEK